jgi:prolyl-tRNA synthetase
MRQSQLFTKTRREAPSDEVSKNAILLTRAGFIHKEMAGVYSLLPLGLRVIKKIENIIRDEMNAIGGIEMKTSILQNKESWEKTNRWSDEVMDGWFKTSLKNGTEVGLSFTNEEAYASLLTQYISSYKDLPIYPYDFKEIFRNEARSKSGVLRGREFYWKALYSFSRDEKEHLEFYERAKQAYKKIFNRVGIGELTYLTFASGGSFSKYSHEFQTLTEAGEDTIYIHKDDLNKGLNMGEGRATINKEIFTDEIKEELGLSDNFEERKAIEVGNIFTLGTRFSEPLGLVFKDEKGESNPAFMGSYGIGLGRLMGTIVEVLGDEKGLVWPKEVAPFRVHLISLGGDAVKGAADEIYQTLEARGIEVLYDDREARAGEKFADADLIGIPTRVVIGEKSLESKMLEVKNREAEEVRHLTIEHLLEELKQ